MREPRLAANVARFSTGFPERLPQLMWKARLVDTEAGLLGAEGPAYNNFMRRRFALSCFLFLFTSSWTWGQSLGELAAKEKERRKKNKEAGKVVKVVTDTELAAGAPPTTEEGSETGEASTPTASYAPSSSATARRSTGTAPARGGERGEGDEGRTTEIPGESSLQDKLSALDGMKRTYQSDVAAIDKEIEKNKARLSEIERALISQNATGLPVVQQPDMTVYNPAQIPALQNEKTQVQARNQELEAKKQALWQDLEAKARRAGIPPGYLRK